MNPPILGTIPPLGEGGDGMGRHLAASPHTGISCFLPCSPNLNDICPIFLLLFLPLDAALLFDVKAAIMGWLLLAVQHYKQHPQHNDVFVIKFNCKFESLLNKNQQGK